MSTMIKDNLFSDLLKSFQKDKFSSFREKAREQFLKDSSNKNISAEFVDPFDGKVVLRTDDNGNYYERYRPSFYKYCIKYTKLIAWVLFVASVGIGLYKSNFIQQKTDKQEVVESGKSPP